jgi:addiction module RelE/StbE family toxin
MVKKTSLPVVWDSEARNKFKEAIKYIRKKSPSGAETVKNAILDGIDLLAEGRVLHFEKDKLKENNDGTHRAFICYDYRVTYKITTENIQILRVRHTSQEPFEY